MKKSAIIISYGGKEYGSKRKKARKEKLSKHINLGNGRYKDHEIEELENIVKNRKKLDGASKTFKNSYKTFDSQDTYRVKERDTYTFKNDKSGIRIDRHHERDWDDGQKDRYHETTETGRDILNFMKRLFWKSKK